MALEFFSKFAQSCLQRLCFGEEISKCVYEVMLREIFTILNYSELILAHNVTEQSF